MIKENRILYKKEKEKREDERKYKSDSREIETRRIGKREDRVMRPVGGSAIPTLYKKSFSASDVFSSNDALRVIISGDHPRHYREAADNALLKKDFCQDAATCHCSPLHLGTLSSILLYTHT